MFLKRTNKYLQSNMVLAITMLTVLRMLASAQTTCNQGVGRVVYERLPDQQLQAYDDEVVRDTAPPFRVLEKCQELCLRDRTATNNLVRTCTSFDFQPGSRIASFSGVVEYEESSCYLTREQASPDGIGVLKLVPNSVHYNEICLSSSRIERECPSRHYVFERHPRKKLKLPTADVKEVVATNRTDCEDRCLNEFTFVCRSATYDTAARTCWLSRFTRRSQPELLEDDPNSEYLENTCLNAERRCDGPIIFVKEENKRLGGPFEIDIYTNISLLECQAQCLKADKFFCRAIEYDEQLKRCIIFEEDSMSQRDDLRTSSSPTHDLYDLICLDNVKGNDLFENPATSHLFQEGRRTDIAFQRYRNSKLGGESHSEINGRTLSECLDECLHQVSFQCRSVVYSERLHICRLSRYNQRDGYRIIYDADYDYYENLMVSSGSIPLPRPDIAGQAYQGHPVVRPPGSGFPGLYGENGYPGYMGAYQGMPYFSSADIPGQGHYPYGNTPGGDISSFVSSPGIGGGGSHAGSITPITSVGYPSPGPTLAPHFSSLAPMGVSASGGLSSSAPYFGGTGGEGGGGLFPGFNNRPTNVRCDQQEQFKQAGIHKRARKNFIRKSMVVPTLAACERECVQNVDFMCRSFNFRATPFGTSKENCELTDRDSRDFDMNNANYFDNADDYDFYERSNFGRSGRQDCLDVSQSCSEDGMEFTIRTPEGFLGRIYTHGYYDRCFYKGNGGHVNVLRISGAQGYPDCGTIRLGDMMTNIVVVQFSEYVQTSKDKRYNLTCLFRGPGEAVVTSNYMTANSGSPTPIEHLPGENSISSRVRLMILYQGRPTNTIAIGDLLTFRLESQDGYNYANDIFATNVVARDPYSGRSVQLIDRYGCPVDSGVFPALDRSREGDGLEARFNAFKIPESNFLVFEATVRTCREGACTPAYCGGSGGARSLGRRKRDVDDEGDPSNEIGAVVALESGRSQNSTGEVEHVHEMIEVFEKRDEISAQQTLFAQQNLFEQTTEPFTSSTCLTKREYYGMIMIIFIFMGLMIAVTITAGIYYKKYWIIINKNKIANSSCGIRGAAYEVKMESPRAPYTPSTSSLFTLLTLNSHRVLNLSGSSHWMGENSLNKVQVPDSISTGSSCQNKGIEDTNEPIYTDASFFERSRSFRSEEFNI